MQAAPFTWGGEFRDKEREAEFQALRYPELKRHFRLVFLFAVFFNLLFLFNDWRFYGQPHFPIALTSRLVIVLTSLLAVFFVSKAPDIRRLTRVAALWSVPVILASVVLVTPGTRIALFVIFVLPMIFILAIPMPFLWTCAAGLACSLATMGSYLANTPDSDPSFGLWISLLTSDAVLILVLIQSNRLRRLEWAATRSEQAANRELSEHRHMLQTLLRAVPAPLLILAKDSGRLLQANAAAHAFFGEETLRDPLAIKRLFDIEELIKRANAPSSKEGVAEFETRLCLDNGVCRDALLVTTTAVVQSAEAVLVTLVDITARKELEAHLQRLASTDSLTGLHNRAKFFELANEEVKRAQRYARPLAAIMLDIDHFKRINDSLGHEAGDAALKTFARLCRGVLREHDILGRIGGEEFALLLPEADQTGALALAERLRETIAAAPMDFSMTVSVGVSHVLPGETEAGAALVRADQALYSAKRAGRNRVALYEPSLEVPTEQTPDALS
jgi:diguanylate cyclase (GGDEF)-like protein